jgi:hypothetical protein
MNVLNVDTNAVGTATLGALTMVAVVIASSLRYAADRVAIRR